MTYDPFKQLAATTTIEVVDPDTSTLGPLNQYHDADDDPIRPRQGATLVTLSGGPLDGCQREIQVNGELPPALFGQLHREGVKHYVMWYRRQNRSRKLTYVYDPTVDA